MAKFLNVLSAEIVLGHQEVVGEETFAEETFDVGGTIVYHDYITVAKKV